MVRNIIHYFAAHKVAPHLLMAGIIIAGIISITQLNVQFLPSFDLDIITINVIWTGASAEDVERSITTPMELELRTIDGLNEMKSTSSRGQTTIILEFKEGTNMSRALDNVNERISLVRNLPPDAETPVITQAIAYETIARLLVQGPSLSEIRHLVHKMERQLLSMGIDKIDIIGLPEEEIAIEVPSESLARLKLSLTDIANILRQESQDLPAGTLAKKEHGKQLRTINQRRSVEAFANTPLISSPDGQLLTVGDVATVKRRPRSGQTSVKWNDKAAVELVLQRAENANTLKAAKVIKAWVKEIKPTLPSSVTVSLYDQKFKLIRGRIMLLVKNGIGGLVLVLLLLFLLLNGRVAFWVAMGIPVAFMAAFIALSFAGGSINMVSLFAFIMVLGIVVDDAVVVGEEGLRRFKLGNTTALKAACDGATTMIAPVFSAQLTTIAAFIPLMQIGDVIGNILFDIPLVVICTLLGSLIESFFILPAHLKHALSHTSKHNYRFKEKIEQYFCYFRDVIFKKLINLAINWRASVLCMAGSIILLIFGLLFSGRLPFSFFPSPDSSIIMTNIEFAAGTPEKTVAQFMSYLEKQLKLVEQQTDEVLIKNIVHYQKRAIFGQDEQAQTGDNVGMMRIELKEPDLRNITNQQLINAWREKIKQPAGLLKLQIQASRAGPPGDDIDIQLSGANPLVLKQAATKLKEEINKYTGVSNIKDDLPFGQKQWVLSLTAQGRMMGVTTENLSRQLFAALTGNLVHIIHDINDEIEVRVTLPAETRDSLKAIFELPIITPDKNFVPLKTVADITEQPGLDILKHTDGLLAVHVTAQVDRSVNNANTIIDSLKNNGLNKVVKKYQVKYTLSGTSKDQAATLNDMKRGLMVALLIIYIILAFIFNAYGWPLLIFTAIPFGLAGGLFGHWLLNIDLTILSLFGLFGLSGVVINDSIILMTTYRRKKEDGMPARAAIIETCCQRLRPVLLTSLTTIAGLTPLLFERSLQAQFLIPMAVSISFGLMFSTVLVLIIIPILLSIVEKVDILK